MSELDEIKARLKADDLGRAYYFAKTDIKHLLARIERLEAVRLAALRVSSALYPMVYGKIGHSNYDKVRDEIDAADDLLRQAILTIESEAE